jgi:phosphohistidine phosphatase
MKIHLIRHAEAIERSADIPEAHRYLTCRGRSKFRRVAVSLKKSGLDPDLIITSPLIRAVQTADILAETLRFSGEVVISPLLAHDFRLSQLRDLLFTHGESTELVLVGHEPDMGALVQHLFNLPFPCTFKKGATVSVNLNVKHPDLEPEFLRLITGGGKVIIDRYKALERLQAN